MKRRDANEAARGMFGDAGAAWEEFEDAASSSDGRVFFVGLIDDNRIYCPWGESAKSYDHAFERASRRARQVSR